MNKIRKLLTVVATLGLMAIVSLPAHGADSWARPMRGEGSGTVTSVTPTDAGVVMKTRSNGRATLLGPWTRNETLVLNPLTGQFTGEAVFFAASGDTLRVLISGGFISPTTATGDYVFDGGTGRFRNASGEARFVVQSEDGVAFDLEFRGVVYRYHPPR